jgi:hypothetical protein
MSTLDGGEWLTSRPYRFATSSVLGYPLNRRFGCAPETFWNVLELRKKFVPARARTPVHSARSLVAILRAFVNNVDRIYLGTYCNKL